MRRVIVLCAAIVLSLITVSVSTQTSALAVVSAGPRDELAELADAGEIRVVFSEPMVALGDAAVTGTPPWVTITPAPRGAFYWSGTRTLIFTPDPAAPLPMATRYTVRIDATAKSVSGHALTAPFAFSFVTPTVRLLSANWYRKTARADSPVVVELRFNQPVRASDVAAHTQLRPVSHQWTAPTMTAAVRSRLSRTDPAGLERFDAKVAATARIARGGGEPIGATPAAAWDERRFPPAPTAVVLETATVPPPESWLAVTIDSRLPSLQGPETHGEQSTTIQLERAFFVNGLPCASGCDPSGYGGLNFTRQVAADAFARTLSVRDVTDPRVDKPIAAASAPTTRASVSSGFTIQDAGFPRQPPDSIWLMAIDSSLTATDGQTLGYPWMGIVENIHEQAFLGIDGSVWEAGGGSTMPLAARNVTSARYWPAPVATGDLLSLLQSFGRAGAALAPSVATRTLAMTATPDAVEGHGMDLRNVLSPGGTGLVWAGMNLDDTIPRVFWPPYNVSRMRSSVLQVTNLGLSVKDSPQSTLVFVTHLDTGAAVAQANITIVDKSNRAVWQGTTDRDGVALAPALTLRRNDSPPYAPPLFIVTAEKDGDVAYVGSDWSGSIQPYAWGLSYQPDEPTEILRGSIFSDRGVYRQGEEAHVKAVLRIDAPSGVRLVPSDTSFDVTVRDPRGRDVDKRRVVVNALSSVEWMWTIPVEGALGRYFIDLRTVDAPANARYRQASGSLLVAQYRRPDFRVDATLAASPAVAGQVLHGAVDAKYLFGAGVAAQPVRWRLTRTATSNVPAAIRQRFPEERYAFGYLATPAPNTPSVIQVATKTEPLDAGGHLAVDAQAESDIDAAYSYSFEGDVESAGGQHIANRAAFVVHPAPFYVGVKRPPFFVDTKAGAAIDIVVAALDGQAMAAVPVTVSLFRQEWQWSAAAGGRGGSSNWERKEIPAGEWTVTTSDRSAMPLQIPVRDGGSYVLRAMARDASGHRTRTDVSFYAVGSGRSSWKVDGNRIDLVPERKTWKPGESARILIQSPWDRATGLLTVEREGIRSHRRFDVASAQDTIEVPITEADVPNVYVSVMLVKGRTADELGPDGTDLGKPSYRVGYTELTVDDAAKHLDVSVSTDRDGYRPKQQVKVDVSVGAPRGRAGATEVTLWAMDYGLLSLTDYRTPDVVKAIYAHKSLGVMTEDNRERLISRRLLAKERTAAVQAQSGERSAAVMEESVLVQGFAGGGGGRGGRGVDFAPAMPAAMPPPPPPSGADQALEVRSDFRSLVFWMGSVSVGADGRATTTVALPDSLTTYRIMAVAGDATSHFGWAEREIKVTKPLTLLPEFPRFMARGDRAAFGAIVTNSSPSGGDAIVTIRSLDPTVLAFGATDRQTLRLAQGATLPVHFDATARGSGSARVQMTVTLGSDTDAFETSLPVTIPSRLETVAAYGDTTTRALEKVVLPAGIVPDVGGLRVELSSTALVGLGESARYLDEYPYECAEQRTSRALALLLTSDLGGAFSLANATPAESRTRASALFEELYSYQCGDGGFALWPGMCQSTSAYLTAYVLHAFRVAGTLNVTIDQNAINRGLNYLQNQLRQPPPEVQWWPAWAASQAYAVKVLAEFNRTPTADIARLYGMVERLPVFAMSYLADAIQASGDIGPRYRAVVQRMTNALRIDADRAHIEEIDDASLVWLWNSNVRATAVVLDGLARRQDDPTFVAPLVRWLVAAQKNGRWGTTHENATALEALVTYYRAHEIEVPDMTATVTLGGRTLGSPAFKGRSTVAQSLDLPMASVVREVARTTTSDLVVSRAGTGRVFYTSRLRYLAPESPSMVDRGLRVERRYERANAAAGASVGTDFAADDLIRVTITINLPREGRYLALTDPMPAGFEPVDANLKTTATDLAAQASISTGGSNWLTWWRRGGFDHVEKHDDRVVAFATRLAAGRHEFSYLVRATTRGTFTAAGARAEEMYAPEVNGRSAASVLQIR